jgi:hypothetical protein
MFHAVIFHDVGGLGYYSLQAKRSGLSSWDSVWMPVVALGADAAARARARALPLSIEEVAREHLEVESMELADHLIFSSAASARRTTELLRLSLQRTVALVLPVASVASPLASFLGNVPVTDEV